MRQAIQNGSTAATAAAAALVLCCLFPTSSQATGDDRETDWGERYLADTGPLRLRDQFVLSLAYLSFDAVSADILAPGRWQIDLAWTVSNAFAHSPEIEEELNTRDRRRPSLDELRAISASASGGSYLLDAEHLRSALALRYGLSERWQLGVSIPIIDLGGGFLDSIIEGFHDEFSFGQAGRLGVPRDDFLIYVGADDREFFRNRKGGAAIGDITVSAKFDLLPAGHQRAFQMAAEAVAKLPTGSARRLTGSGSVDFGAQVILTRYFPRSCLHASLGLAYLGPWADLGLSSQLNVSGMLAFERSLAANSSVIAQLTLSQSPFWDLDLSGLRDFSTLITIGLKQVIGRQVVFFGFTENAFNLNNTQDIGLHLGITRTF